MSLTNIGDQRTPGRPVEITFGADLGLPSANQEVLLIGHAAASGGSIPAYNVTTISNSADPVAAETEANTKFGAGSELTKMVLAAIKANAGGGTFPVLKACPLEFADTGFGPSDEALTAVDRVKAEFVVSPYDGNDSITRNKLRSTAIAMSGAQRVQNNQFGTFGVIFNRSVVDPSTLPVVDNYNMIAVWLPDTGAPTYGIGEMAAASAARMAALTVPFNPLDNETIQNIEAPADQGEWITVGAGLESEAALMKGWTPLRVKPNEEVAIVRSVTTRLSVDGTGAPIVNSYYDVQDFMVLFFWRKTIFTRLSQPDLSQTKASEFVARNVKSELIRLATLFEEQNMFQAVSQLAKQFQVVRASTDRHRFDVKTPVNVIPGLHVIASNIEAGTQFDVISV